MHHSLHWSCFTETDNAATVKGLTSLTYHSLGPVGLTYNCNSNFTSERGERVQKQGKGKRMKKRKLVGKEEKRRGREGRKREEEREGWKEERKGKIRKRIFL